MNSNRVESILCVANWDSNVGYAWWLMESYWTKIAEDFCSEFRVLLAYPSISVLPSSVASSGLEVCQADFSFRGVLSILRQIKFIIDNNIKYIYFSDRPTGNWRYFLYRLAGVRKIVIHDHKPGCRDQAKSSVKILKYVRSRIPLYTVSVAIGATDFVTHRLISVNCLPADKCFSVPNGLPEPKLSQADVNIYKQFGIPEDATIIVSTGRASKYKGIDFALEVIKKVKERINTIHYLYCGDGPDLNYFIQRTEALGLVDHVTFPGRITGIVEILGCCDIAFHPSQGEVGYSLSILEYMQAGLPTVVPNNPSVCGATKDGKTGLLYEEGDIISASKKIYQLLENPGLRHQFGKDAREIVQQKYALDTAHQALSETLKRIFQPSRLIRSSQKAEYSR